MIAYFPAIYPDELLYSQLARYHAKSGYMVYRCTAEDLFKNPTVRPDIDFVNSLSLDALNQITRTVSIESVIEKHTMFAYYGRFLNQDRRNKAFRALVSMQGNYNNLLPIPKRKSNNDRFLRYCPICADNDRENFGETYWHRIHQMQGVNICPLHHCKLIDSNVIISGKASPTLTTAEEVITISEPEMCENEIERRLATYIMKVFQSDVDLNNDVLVGDFLYSKMSGTKYRSVRGEQRNISLFHTDFTEYYKALPDNWFTELWQIQKVLANDRINVVEICMLAMFLHISVDELCNMTLPQKSQQQLFDEEICRLHKQGLDYAEIADRLNASVHTVKCVGQGRYGTYHREKSQPLKSGVKSKDWHEMDNKNLPLVQEAINSLEGDGISRPKRVTVASIEKMLALRPKQLDNMPMCKAEIQRHQLSQEEYWAIEVAWAVKRLVNQGSVINWKHLRELTNMRKQNLSACLVYLDKFADSEVVEMVEDML